LVISDRKKDVIISGGENVSSIEVEDVITSHPAVARGRGDRDPGRQVGRAGDRARRDGRIGRHRRGVDRPLP
jgi:acyl-CoA synthetase (AMP-forming)/AMP-acid ligase II